MQRAMLESYSVPELLAEVQRRSLGCLIVIVEGDPAAGDQWTTLSKGSPILMGAMSAAMTMECNRRLARGGDDA
jgi:hypothetical protein